MKDAVTIKQIEHSLQSIAAMNNMRAVDEPPLSKELEARSCKQEKFF